MNFCKISQNAAILKIINISKNCHGRFTANYPKFLSFKHMNSKKNVIQFYTHLFKDLKDLSRMLSWAHSKLDGKQIFDDVICDNWRTNMVIEFVAISKQPRNCSFKWY